MIVNNPFEMLIQQNTEIIQQNAEIIKCLRVFNPSGFNDQSEIGNNLKHDPDQRLTTDQIAEYLRKDKSTIMRYKKNGAIPYHQVGRTVYFIKSEVDAALSSMAFKKKGGSI